MIRVATFILMLIGSVAWADDPPPTPAQSTITAPKEAAGTGKRSDPFTFDSSTKCVLRLQGASGDIEWDLEDCPADTEAIEGVLVFSLSEPGDYVAWASWTGGRAKAWFRVAGPRGPPSPVDDLTASITRRVKAAFAAGNPGDAKSDAAKFKAACDALATALDAGSITKLGQMEDALKAGLTANGWVPGKYQDLSKLSGELWGAGVPDGVIDVMTKTRFVGQLKTISKACEGVK